MGYFENRYKQLCPDFTSEVELKNALRINTLRMTEQALIKRLKKNNVKLENIKGLDAGYYYEAEFSLGATPEFLLGYYYLQGVASQLVAQTLGPGKKVLDMAAAPGSKTTHLAQLMKNKGIIYAVDSNAKRLTALRNNCERLFAQNVVMIQKDARYVADLKETFDKVLLDAPCSGNFCSEEGWFQKRRIEDVKKSTRMQKELLQAAYAALESGGILVYSTCSLEPEEDEVMIDWLLEKHSDLSLIDIKGSLGESGITAWGGKELNSSLKKTRRFWPHKTRTEGFFIAKIKKK